MIGIEYCDQTINLTTVHIDASTHVPSLVIGIGYCVQTVNMTSVHIDVSTGRLFILKLAHMRHPMCLVLGTVSRQ